MKRLLLLFFLGAATSGFSQKDDPTQTYMIVCHKWLEPQVEAAALCFLQYNGKWILNQID